MQTCIVGRREATHHALFALKTSRFFTFSITVVWRGRPGGIYNQRHDAILKVITDVVRCNIPSTTTLTADISDSYTFPLHIITTDLRPDLVWWDEVCKSLTLAELTVYFETNFEKAARRKSAKYTHLVEQAQARGYKTELITLQVGSRGVPDLPAFENLAAKLSLPPKELVKLLEDTSRLALAGSFSIWCTRNKVQ